MPITPNYDSLWDSVQNTEYVTFTKVTPTGSTTSYGGVHALGRAIYMSPTEAGGVQMTPATTKWHLRARSLPPSVVPDRGDRIVSVLGRMQGTWVVKSVNVMTAGTRYECECQRLEDV